MDFKSRILKRNKTTTTSLRGWSPYFRSIGEGVHQDVDAAKVGLHGFGTFLHNIKHNTVSITSVHAVTSRSTRVRDTLAGTAETSIDTEKRE